MKTLNTSPKAIEFNPSCSVQAQFNKLGTGYGNENREPGCNLTVLTVPFIILPLRSADV